jgi:hypothetical protein
MQRSLLPMQEQLPRSRNHDIRITFDVNDDEPRAINICYRKSGEASREIRRGYIVALVNGSVEDDVSTMELQNRETGE